MFKQLFKKSVKVGWHIDPDRGRIIWYPPEEISLSNLPEHTKELAWEYTALKNSSARYALIRCPFDINIKIVVRNGKIGFQSLSGDNWGISMQSLRKFLHVSAPYQWRHPRRPLVQFATPYRFAADEKVFISQLPPFHDYRYMSSTPGILVSGRFPIDVWPRIFMWALEWHDIERPMVFKRGDPWFIMMFESEKPNQPLEFVEIARTPEFVDYITQVDGVTSYVNQTFSLFKTGWLRRPKKLLKPRVY